MPGDALQATLDAFLARTHTPGVSAAILWPDGTIWTGTSGLADVGAGRAVTPNDAFGIGSMSKTFTAALILQLVDEGRLSLDDPVRRWLPAAKVGPGVTVRMLLDHTSGLFDVFFHPSIDRTLLGARGRRWTTAQILGYQEAPYFPAGTGWHYSNTNYLYLGLLAERITGRPLGAELRLRFLDPLGLGHTWYQPGEQARAATVHAYRLDGSGAALHPVDLSDGSPMMPFTSVVTAVGAAGGIASTPADLVRWARALYGGRVLSAAGLTRMLDDATATASLRPTVPYGLGVEEVSVGPWLTFGHDGRLLGSRGVMRYLPDDEVAVTVLANQSGVDVGPLAEQLLRLVVRVPVHCRRCA